MAAAFRQGDQALMIDGTEVTASATELNRAADATGGNQALTATAAVTAGVRSLTLAHASVVIAATIADTTAHTGFFDGAGNGTIVVNTGSVALSG